MIYKNANVGHSEQCCLYFQLIKWVNKLHLFIPLKISSLYIKQIYYWNQNSSCFMKFWIHKSQNMDFNTAILLFMWTFINKKFKNKHTFISYYVFLFLIFFSIYFQIFWLNQDFVNWNSLHWMNERDLIKKK